MNMNVPPFERTGKIIFDSLLYCCHVYGCENIAHTSNVITCTRNEQRFSIVTTAQTTCIDVLRAIGLFAPMPPRPARNIRYMSEQSYNKAKQKRGSKKRHAA